MPCNAEIVTLQENACFSISLVNKFPVFNVLEFIFIIKFKFPKYKLCGSY